ncbi:MAG: hypothetical protein ACRCS7_12375 [Tannerellaceae bacterium]
MYTLAVRAMNNEKNNNSNKSEWYNEPDKIPYIEDSKDGSEYEEDQDFNIDRSYDDYDDSDSSQYGDQGWKITK